MACAAGAGTVTFRESIIKIPPAHISQIVSVIRGQLASRVELAASKPRTRLDRPAPGKAHSGSRNIEAEIGRRIRAIRDDDPRRGRKAFHIFLEAVLLAQLGDHLINDPTFQQIIDEVQDSMEADTELRSLIDAAINHLLSGTQ